MTRPILDRPGVMARVGQRIPAAVPQHMRVNLERQLGALTDALD